jgi:hypothetical protein
MYWVMSKPFTSPANLQAKALASNAVMFAMPDFPANKLAQDSVAVFPTGAMQPSPVTTTRRLVMPANLSGSAEQLLVGACGSIKSRRPQSQCQLANQAF